MLTANIICTNSLWKHDACCIILCWCALDNVVVWHLTLLLTLWLVSHVNVHSSPIAWPLTTLWIIGDPLYWMFSYLEIYSLHAWLWYQYASLHPPLLPEIWTIARFKRNEMHMDYIIRYTVEFLNKGHFGNRPFVLCSEVFLISEVCHILTLNNP